MAEAATDAEAEAEAEAEAKAEAEHIMFISNGIQRN